MAVADGVAVDGIFATLASRSDRRERPRTIGRIRARLSTTAGPRADARRRVLR